LSVGDILLCYSDGITEACNASAEEFGEERCAQIMSELGKAPEPFVLDHLLDEIRRAAAQFTNQSELEDDCTLLALRRLANQVPTDSR
jgi:sigma-B regulation protein RsbU (phosphoserine phosphatase)